MGKKLDGMDRLAERAEQRRNEREAMRVLRVKAGRRKKKTSDRYKALEYFAALPTPTLLDLRDASEVALSSTREDRAKKQDERVPWSRDELDKLSLRLPATQLALQLPGRSVWAISHKRRQLGIRQKTGPVVKGLSDYPGTDWTLSANQLSRQLGIAFVTASRLKALALAQHADSLEAG